MSGGYFVDESTHIEDMSHITQPKELSVDSPCGAVTLPEPEPAPTKSTKEVL